MENKDFYFSSNKIIEENQIFSKRQLFFNNLEEIDEKDSIKEKYKEKLSLRKKKNNEYINKFRKDKLKRNDEFLKTNNFINYNNIINQIPNEIIEEFNNTKNKYDFFIKYLSISDENDPNFYIRMFVIYHIHNYVNNDITNSSIPSPNLMANLLKYFMYDYKSELLIQKVTIQNEIIQMLIIWSSYIDEDNTNNIIYDDYFIFYLLCLLENNSFSIEFKINIIILFNHMIKGINSFNKIMQKNEIINKIERIFYEIKKDEQYIYILSLIIKIFDISGEYYDEINYNKMNINEKYILFMDSYNKFIKLLKNCYEKYQSIYEDYKNNKLFLSMDNSARIYYKINLELLQIIDYSMYLEDNSFYVNSLISNEALPLFFKILETFSNEFFLEINNNNQFNKFQIINNIYLESKTSIKNKEKNNLYKKYKVLRYLTNILSEIICMISKKENDIKQNGNNSELVSEFIKKFNFINYYSNFLKNIICVNIEPDKYVILRIEELIYNFCKVNKNNNSKLYKNYDLVRELLEINIKYYHKNNFLLMIKFIIESLLLYDTEVASALIFNVKIISIFCKYLERELNNNEKNFEIISFILYSLKIICDSEAYKKYNINRNQILYEFNENNAIQILEQYAVIIKDEQDYMIINQILGNLDETDILDNNQIEDIFN